MPAIAESLRATVRDRVARTSLYGVLHPDPIHPLMFTPSDTRTSIGGPRLHACIRPDKQASACRCLMLARFVQRRRDGLTNDTPAFKPARLRGLCLSALRCWGDPVAQCRYLRSAHALRSDPGRHEPNRAPLPPDASPSPAHRYDCRVRSTTVTVKYASVSWLRSPLARVSGHGWQLRLRTCLMPAVIGAPRVVLLGWPGLAAGALSVVEERYKAVMGVLDGSGVASRTRVPAREHLPSSGLRFTLPAGASRGRNRRLPWPSASSLCRWWQSPLPARSLGQRPP